MAYPEIFSMAQLFGYASMAFSIFASTRTSDRSLLLLGSMSSLLIGIHYIMLAAPVAGLMAGLTGIRYIWGRQIRGWKLAAPFLTINFCTLVFAEHNLIAVLAVLATSFGIVAVSFLDGFRMRVGFMGAGATWIIHNLIVGSIGGLILSVINMAIQGSTAWRMIRANIQSDLRRT